MRHFVRQTIRFADVDPAGIVFYPRFYEHFHNAFEDFFDVGMGKPYAQVIGVERLGFPAVHIETDFKKPLHHGEAIDIEIRVLRLGVKSFTCHYRVLRDAEMCATANITVVCASMKDLATIAIPEDYRAFLSRYLEPATEAHPGQGLTPEQAEQRGQIP